jgi:hypothetical protein
LSKGFVRLVRVLLIAPVLMTAPVLPTALPAVSAAAGAADPAAAEAAATAETTLAAADAADPVDHSQPRAPDGTPVCAKWVHDRYAVERGGRTWPPWHPPRDPRYGCAFGHIACGPHDPAGWDSYCKGDKRAVFHPRWVVRNRGRSRFRTDAYGRRAGAGLLQVVARRLSIDQSRECCGAENRFDMQRPSDGGIYRAARGRRPGNFEFPGYCVIRSN